jgi:hypothetical protein
MQNTLYFGLNKSSKKFWEFEKVYCSLLCTFIIFVQPKIWSFELNFAHLWDTSQATFRLF